MVHNWITQRVFRVLHRANLRQTTWPCIFTRSFNICRGFGRPVSCNSVNFCFVNLEVLYIRRGVIRIVSPKDSLWNRCVVDSLLRDADEGYPDEHDAMVTVHLRLSGMQLFLKNVVTPLDSFPRWTIHDHEILLSNIPKGFGPIEQ